MIGCDCWLSYYDAESSRGQLKSPLLLVKCLQRSVLRARPPAEAPFIPWMHPCQPIMFYSIKVVAFWDFIAINTSCHILLNSRFFARPLAELCLYCWLLIVELSIPLIESAWRELSNGGHIVLLSNLDLSCEILGCRLDFQAADGFLTPFLTETI